MLIVGKNVRADFPSQFLTAICASAAPPGGADHHAGAQQHGIRFAAFAFLLISGGLVGLTIISTVCPIV